MEHSDYNTEAFIQFLRQGAMEGLLNPAVARSRLKAAEQLFVELTEAERNDLRLLDVDALSQRFHKIHDSTIRPEVLALYNKRLTAALFDYLNWLNKPTEFQSVGGDTRKKDKRYQSSDKENNFEQKALEEITLSTDQFPRDIIAVPIRDDCTVYIQNTPLDLTESEAGKISRVIKALAETDSIAEQNLEADE